jgi:protein-tyrosine-phosphatase
MSLSRKEKQMLRLLMAKAGIPVKSNLKVAPATTRTCQDTHNEFKAFMLKKGINVLKAEPSTYTTKDGKTHDGIRTLCSNGVAYMNGTRLSWRV